MKTLTVFISFIVLSMTVQGFVEEHFNRNWEVVAIHYGEFIPYDSKLITRDADNNIVMKGDIKQTGLLNLPATAGKIIPYFIYKEGYHMVKYVDKGKNIVVGFYPAVAEYEVSFPDGLKTKQYGFLYPLEAAIPASDFQNKTGRYLKP